MINDFIEYWAAAKLLLSGGNPYSAAQLLQLQRTVGWSKNEALLMWNPLGTLFFHRAARFARLQHRPIPLVRDSFHDYFRLCAGPLANLRRRAAKHMLPLLFALTFGAPRI
jgi:hypothetical protein